MITLDETIDLTCWDRSEPNDAIVLLPLSQATDEEIERAANLDNAEVIHGNR